ncbi:MAG TPA: hypothetical protein VGO93_25905 [Candidatus Xenobia bacterium]|jgi:hypothetical protein
MDVQYEVWKTELAQNKTIDMPVNTDRLQPLLTVGDKVQVRKVPLADINLGDILFCVLAGKAGLRRVSNIRSMYGNKSLEVTDDEGLVKSIPEAAILGKVVKTRRKGAAPEALSTGGKVLRIIKKIIFPGT